MKLKVVEFYPRMSRKDRARILQGQGRNPPAVGRTVASERYIHLKPGNVKLYGNKRGVCRCNQVKDLDVRSSWIMVGPKSSEKGKKY